MPEGPQRFEYGPLLFAGFREGDSARVVPVAELVDGVLRPLPPGEAGARMAEQVHGGTSRTGSTAYGLPWRHPHRDVYDPGLPGNDHRLLLPQGPGLRSSRVGPKRIRGRAVSRCGGRYRGAWPFGRYQSYVAERAHRNAIQNLAGVALNEVRAQWPTALQNIRQDLQLFLPPRGETPAIVASFLFQDQMEIGPAPDPAYSLLVVGEPAGRQFNRTFTWYRRVADEGKGAPRFFSWMDWDQDGEDEIILEVFGADSKWWAALERENGNWTVAFQDPCGTPEAQVASTEGSQDGQG